MSYHLQRCLNSTTTSLEVSSSTSGEGLDTLSINHSYKLSVNVFPAKTLALSSQSLDSWNTFSPFLSTGQSTNAYIHSVTMACTGGAGGMAAAGQQGGPPTHALAVGQTVHEIGR